VLTGPRGSRLGSGLGSGLGSRLGSLWGQRDREIIRLAVPALGALVAEPLFLLADSAVVGTLGVGPLAGLAVAATVLGTLVGLCVFLAYGTTASVARLLGAGDRPAALRQGVDGMWLGLGLGVALGLVLVAVAQPLTRALGASPATAAYAVTYLRISTLGLPAMLVVLAATGVLRGLQDTVTPLVVAVVAAVANLALELLLVLVLHRGIAGSAAATVVAQWGAATAFAVVVGRGLRGSGTALRPDARGVRSAATASVPLLVRTVALRLVFVVSLVVAAGIGDRALAAYQVSLQTWYLLALVLDALAIAAQAMVGRLLGAGDVAEARATLHRLVWWGVLVGAGLGVVVLLLRPAYVLLFTSDAGVRRELAAALVLVAAHQVVAGATFVLDGVLIGAGDARFLAVAQTATLVLYLPAAWLVVASGGGLVALWVALGYFMMCRLALLGWRAHGDAWLVTGAVR
jgi:putative MATE family efflux protein